MCMGSLASCMDSFSIKGIAVTDVVIIESDGQETMLINVPAFKSNKLERNGQTAAVYQFDETTDRDA